LQLDFWTVGVESSSKATTKVRSQGGYGKV